MRILYFSPRACWPPNTGAMLRDYHLAAEITRGAAVTWFSLRQPGENEIPIPAESNPFENLISVAKSKSYTAGKLLRGLIGPDPVTVLNFWSPQAARVLQTTLRSGNFDTIQVESVHLIRYIPMIRACSPATAIIADWHNIESEIMRRYALNAPTPAHRIFATRTAQLIERAEYRLLKECDAHAVASDRERAQLAQRVPEARLYTIPNGVDVAFHRPDCRAPAASDSAAHLLFVGSMDYHANIDAVEWFVREVWPLLTAGCPAIGLTIAGRNPDARVRALATGAIAVTGTVDDVRPYYSRASAVVVPLRVGGGTRLKILEAMAAGVPVVSTSLGAEGLEVTSGENLLLANTPEEIVAAIGALASDPDLRARIVRAGFDLVERLYDWRALGERLLSIHREAAAHRGSKIRTSKLLRQARYGETLDVKL